MPHIHELIDFTVSIYIVNKNRVLLVDHKKQKKWLPIGGHVELHEDTDQALSREIKEECGLEVRINGEVRNHLTKELKPLRVPQFMDIHEINSVHKHLNLIYFGYAESDKANLAKEEHYGLKWFTEEDLTGAKFGVTPNVRFYAKEALKSQGKGQHA